MKEIATVFDDKSAKSMLRLWLRDRKTKIVCYYSCAQFSYSERLFWAIVVKLFGLESSFNGVYGFHIYENGEVKLIGKQD